MVSLTITSGWKQWFFIGAYVPPKNRPTVHQVDKALARCLEGMETLLVGNLNAHMAKPCNQREEGI